MARQCPNCSSTMSPETAHGAQIDVCPNCGGIWLDGEELRAILSSDIQTIDAIEASVRPEIGQHHAGRSNLLCPENGIALDEYRYLYNSPIPIHACPVCGGMFIHAEQLPLMQQWFARTQEPPSHDEALRIAMGQDIAEHEAFMLRQRHLIGMFNTFRSYRPGWWGLL